MRMDKRDEEEKSQGEKEWSWGLMGYWGCRRERTMFGVQAWCRGKH